MSPVRPPDPCGGGDLQWVRDNASEPGPITDSHTHTREPERTRQVAAKARALADFTNTRGNYDHHLSEVAAAWADIFHRPITIREVIEALAAVEILRAK